MRGGAVGNRRATSSIARAVEKFAHTRTKAKSPQTNGICERFNKTILNEFYRTALRGKLYETLDDLQLGLDDWMRQHNEERPHQDRWCFDNTPSQTFLDSVPIAMEKTLPAQHRLTVNQAARTSSVRSNRGASHHGRFSTWNRCAPGARVRERIRLIARKAVSIHWVAA